MPFSRAWPRPPLPLQIALPLLLSSPLHLYSQCDSPLPPSPSSLHPPPPPPPATVAEASADQVDERQRAVAAGRDEEVLAVRRGQDGVDPLAGSPSNRSLGRREAPSIASRPRAKSSLVGLNTTKWSPRRPGAGVVGGRVDGPGKRVVEGVEVGAVGNGRSPPGRRPRRGRRRRGPGVTPSGSPRCGRSPGAVVVVHGPRRRSSVRGPGATVSVPGATASPGRRRRRDAGPRGGTRPRGPRGRARGAWGCHAVK